ncbi:MAG TPA: hypothetical protein VGO68_11415 [Pyrinomonadaceae bacterium]|jgi:hypothetical protein|nr:hypothetical protein [Pyrinomonadaceae bacterium]
MNEFGLFFSQPRSTLTGMLPLHLATTPRISSGIAIVARAIGLMLVIVFLAVAALAQAAPSPDGWVVLPVGEYAALRHLAFPTDAEPLPPPVEATLSRIDYNLKVDGDLASGEARLTVDVIKDGWVRLALPNGLMVQEAKLDGRQVTLLTREGGKGPGGADLLLAKIGRAVLTLKIVAPVSTVAGTDILQLPVSNSAVSHASVELTRQGVDVHITGGLLLEHSELAAGSRWVANGNGAAPLTFAWRRKVDDQRANQPLRLRGAVTELVGLGEDTTQVSAEVNVEVLQGLAQEIRVLLPEQFTVNQVSGAMVADWDAKVRELTVSFIEPVQTTVRFTINGELRLPRAGKLDVPLLRLPAAERETGGVAVEVLGAGEIKERQANGLDEAEASQLGQLISSRQSPSLIAFRLQPADGKSLRTLSLNVARYTPQAVLTANIEEADYSALVTTDGKLLIQSRFAVRNNQRNFLKLTLPATAVLWSASVAGRPVRPGRAPDGSLLLPLEKTRSGDDAPAFVVEVSYLDHTPPWSDKGHVRLSLLAVDLPISKSRLLLHHPPLFRLTPPPGISSSFRVTPYEVPESAVLRSGSNPTPAGDSDIIQVDAAGDATKELVSRLRDTKRPTVPARNLPLRVAFPHFGPSLFLKSELTSESQTPVVELDFQRDKKRGE